YAVPKEWMRRIGNGQLVEWLRSWRVPHVMLRAVFRPVEARNSATTRHVFTDGLVGHVRGWDMMQWLGTWQRDVPASLECRGWCLMILRLFAGCCRGRSTILRS